MGLKCRFIGHDYNLSKKEPSQTFRIPCDTDNPAECIKRTTKTSHYKCSRCDSRKSEDLVNDEIVIVDWKKEQVDSEADEHTKERRTSEQAHQEAKQREGVDNEADDLTTGSR